MYPRNKQKHKNKLLSLNDVFLSQKDHKYLKKLNKKFKISF